MVSLEPTPAVPLSGAPLVALALCAATAGCDPPAPPPVHGAELTLGRCGRGVAVVATDYASTNVALLDRSGSVATSSLLTSGSAPAGLSAPLSGDVALPTAARPSGDLVLIDRYLTSVVTWVTPGDAVVRAQLDVRTGFSSNPQDYLELGPHRAYVSRFETNPAPGHEALDAGGDVLVVDPRAPALVSRIDLAPAMSDAPGFLPRANRMLRHGDRVVVVLGALSADFSDSAPSRVAILAADRDEVVGSLRLDGLHGCVALAQAPTVESESPALFAVGCTGSFRGSLSQLDQSGLVVLALEGDEVSEVARFLARDVAGRGVGFSLDFIDRRRLLVTTFGAFGEAGAPDVGDALLELDIESAAVRVLHETKPFELGEARCMTALDPSSVDAEGCGVCYAADAALPGILRLVEGDAGLVIDAAIDLADPVGLPPRGLGRL
jgi:hypothetical protein